MHSEYAHLPQATADLINQTHANGKQVIAIGTTVTRVLETAYQKQRLTVTHCLAGQEIPISLFIRALSLGLLIAC